MGRLKDKLKKEANRVTKQVSAEAHRAEKKARPVVKEAAHELEKKIRPLAQDLKNFEQRNKAGAKHAKDDACEELRHFERKHRDTLKSVKKQTSRTLDDAKVALKAGRKEGKSAVTQHHLDILDDNGNAQIHRAVLEGDEFALNRLLVKGCNIDLRNGDGQTALVLAVNNSRMRMANNLLHLEKADRQPLEALDHTGQNCLHHAVQRADMDAIQFLLKTGVSTAISSKHGLTAIEIAATNGSSDIAVLLVGYIQSEPSSPEILNQALRAAKQNDHTEVFNAIAKEVSKEPTLLVFSRSHATRTDEPLTDFRPSPR